MSSRVALVETVTGIDRDYYIQAVEFVYSDDDLLQFVWTVVPTDPYDYWLIGTSGYSEVGQTTVLGY